MVFFENEELLEELTSHIDSTLLGLDENIGQLEQVFLSFYETGQGDSFIVSGPRRSGRWTAIQKALRVIKGKVTIKHLNTLCMGTDAKGLNLLEEDSDEEDVEEKASKSKSDSKRGKSGENTSMDKKVVVVRGADELAARSKQALLYKLLNSARTSSMLVVLVVDRHDFVMALEKRIRSRISSKKIQFGQMSMTIETYMSYCKTLLLPTKVDKQWAKLMKEFLKEDAELLLKSLFEFDHSVVRLKSVLAVFVQEMMYDAKWTNEMAKTHLKTAIGTAFSKEHYALPNLMALSTRACCLLLCVIRRARYISDETPVSYRRIITDYKQIANTIDHRMRVENDVELYKELDRLGDLHLIDAFIERGCTNLAYKRATLSCWPQALEKALENCDIPISIREWANTQPST